MHTRLLTIVLLVLLVAPASDGFTPLTLGAAPGATAGLQTGEQAASLATKLKSALGEEVQLQLFTEQAELGRWLQQSTVPALAVVDDEYLRMHRRDFMLLGPAEPGGPLQIVAGPDMDAELQQRVMTALSGESLPAALPPQSAQGFQLSRSTGPLQAAIPGPEAALASPLQAPPESVPPALPTTRAEAPFGPGLAASPVAAEVSAFDESLASSSVEIAPAPGETSAPRVPAAEPPAAAATNATESSGAVLARRLAEAAAVKGPPSPTRGFQLPSSIGPLQATSPVAVAPLTTPPVLPPSAAAPLLATTAPAPADDSAPKVVPTKVELTAGPEILEPIPDAATPVPVEISQPLMPYASKPAIPAERAAVEPPLSTTGGEAPEAVAVEVPPKAQTVAEPQPVSSASLVERHTEALVAEAVPVLEDTDTFPESLIAIPSTAPAPTATVAVPPTISAPQTPTVPEPPAPASVEQVVTEPPGATPATAIAGDVVAEQTSSAVTVAAEPPPAPPLSRDDLAASSTPTTESGVIAPAAVLVAAGTVPSPPATSGTLAAAVPETVPPAEPPGMEMEADAAQVPVQIIEPLQPVAVAPPPGLVATTQGETATPEVAAPATAAAPETAVVSTESQEATVPLVLPGGVPEMIAQPDLPYELRPMGVPLPRPTAPAKAADIVEEPALLGTFQSLLAKTPTPEPLIPPPDPDPGVVYVIPFISLMVPQEVNERVFDGFVDILNQRGQGQKLKFVILKKALGKIDRNWLAARKHVMGEIFGYVEDSGCCSTTLRAHARLTYYRANQAEPALKFDYPIQVFFDHDRSNLTIEREKLADQIVSAMVGELFKTLQR